MTYFVVYMLVSMYRIVYTKYKFDFDIYIYKKGRL